MFNKTTLPNGLTIVTENIPFVRSVAFGIWVKNGSRNEELATNGISHFIEHMLFKGTANRTAKEIADEIDAVGGQLNAYTSKEYTCYYVRALDTHFDLVLDILADMFFNSRFDEDDINKERKVIIEEINMYEDTPEELAHDLLQYNFWKGNSLGLPILGTEETISSFNRSTFKSYFQKNYRPESTVVAVAGNFKDEEMLKKIEERFSGFKGAGESAKQSDSSKVEYYPCIVYKEKEIEQVHISMGFPSISIGSDDSYVLAVLNTIFGGGMSSRLFQTIREEQGLAYSVYSYNSSFTNSGLFSIYAGLNRSQTLQVINLIVNEVKKLFSEKITPLQLERTKEQLKSNYILSLESTNSRMTSIGRSMLMLNRIMEPEDIMEKIDAVTNERLDSLIEKIFNLKNMSFSAVGNIKGFDFNEIIEKERNR